MARTIETGCTIEIEQTHDCFHAHLALDGEIEIAPGDRVHVHGEPIRVAFGERRTERRRATVLRAGSLRRAWTRLKSRFELKELYEVSFTPRRSL
jgi:ABC-type molybdate transport system substrate-binding protein